MKGQGGRNWREKNGFCGQEMKFNGLEYGVSGVKEEVQNALLENRRRDIFIEFRGRRKSGNRGG
jgi:hypothetical protein